MTREFIHSERIAYFTMEIALRSDMPTYSGGLGVLAGDTVRSAADLELPQVSVSLAIRMGYFRQRIDEAGRQQLIARPNAVETLDREDGDHAVAGKAGVSRLENGLHHQPCRFPPDEDFDANDL